MTKSITLIRILYPILIFINLFVGFLFINFLSIINFLAAIFILIIWIIVEKQNNEFYEKYGEYV